MAPPTPPRTTPPRATAQGAAVREVLSAQKGFRSAQDIYATLRSTGKNVGLSTVYRHLQSLTDQALADVIHTADGETVYRFCGTAGEAEHHHHLVCRACGRAEEIEGRAIERWTDDVARSHGFVDVQHTIEIFGTCPDCAR